MPRAFANAPDTVRSLMALARAFYTGGLAPRPRLVSYVRRSREYPSPLPGVR